MTAPAIMRMALARHGRPETARVRWQPYIEPEFSRFDCLACADADIKEAVLVADGHRLFLCRGCGSHQFWPLPAVAWEEAPAAVAVDHYLQRGAGLETLAAHVARLIAGRVAGRFLDVGCGVGFAVDMARRRGWQATGVEPSGFGQVGADLLGVALFHGALEALGAPDPDACDAVLCTETIEHSPEPANFLAQLWRQVGPGGRLLLTAPDCASLYRDQSEGSLMALLSPGSHMFLPSGEGLAALFARAGCPGPRIAGGAPSLTAELSRPAAAGAPAVTPAPLEEGYDLVVGYLRSVLAAPAHDRMRLAANIRLLVMHGDRGEWLQAAAVRRALEPQLLHAVARVQAGSGHAGQPDLVELHAMMPPGLPAALFYEAMACLNFDADPRRAALLFDATAELAMLAWRAAPSVFLDEKDISDNARFHAALARDRAGQSAAARLEAQALVADDSVGDLWRDRARNEILVPA